MPSINTLWIMLEGAIQEPFEEHENSRWFHVYTSDGAVIRALAPKQDCRETAYLEAGDRVMLQGFWRA